MSFKCDYCSNTFTTKKILNKHQKNARYCLTLQGKSSSTYSCECGKSYTLRESLVRHKLGCTSANVKPTDELLTLLLGKYDNMVQEFQTQINDLKKQTDNSTSAGNSNGNNRNMVLNNLQPLTDEQLQGQLEHLTLNFIQDGAKGYAAFANFYPLRDFVVCTDKARKKIRYKNEYGELTDDARTLAKRFFQAISQRNKLVLDQAYSDLQTQLDEIVASNKAGETDVTGLLSKATALQDILMRSQRAARGEDEEFTQDFLNHLTRML